MPRPKAFLLATTILLGLSGVVSLALISPLVGLVVLGVLAFMVFLLVIYTVALVIENCWD